MVVQQSIISYNNDINTRKEVIMRQYPKYPDFGQLGDMIRDYSSLKTEVGSLGIQKILDDIEAAMKAGINALVELEEDEELANNEPNDLASIKALRPDGPRRLWFDLDKALYQEKLTGAFIARLAACTLGAPVEFWSVEDMERWAKYIGDEFPPRDYWSMIKNPYELRYTKGDFIRYTRDHMNQVPVDDDIAYTLLNLLVVETYGLDFSVEDVAKSWIKYLPMAYTAEKVTLENLSQGLSVSEACLKNNPYYQWIGADIRSDGFAYMAPGYPEKAAELAYKDASLSHRRNGIYGEMFFAAAQSAAFSVNDPMEAIRIGLSEIPKDCMLAKDIRWALDVCGHIKDYKDARALVDKRFDGMSHAHTNNNACLTIFGLYLGGSDVTRVISETVAMGMDNDCTAATAGSIAGAIAGISNIEAHWYQPFNGCIDSYLKGIESFDIDDVIQRFMTIGKLTHMNHH